MSEDRVLTQNAHSIHASPAAESYQTTAYMCGGKWGTTCNRTLVCACTYVSSQLALVRGTRELALIKLCQRLVVTNPL